MSKDGFCVTLGPGNVWSFLPYIVLPFQFETKFLEASS